MFEGCIFTAVKNTKDVSKTTIMGALVNLLLNVILIPLIGATGAALATMVGYCSVWIVRTLQVRKIVQLSINWRVQIASLSLLVCQASFAMIAELYWIQIIPACLLLFVQRNTLIKVGKLVVSKLASR